MKSIDIVRAWKNAHHSRGLSPQELPDEMALTEKELSKVMGGDDGGHRHEREHHEREHRHEREHFRHEGGHFRR